MSEQSASEQSGPEQPASERSGTERSLVLVKPDGVRRGLVGQVISRIEAKGYRLVAVELCEAHGDLLDAHYAEHVEKPFYPPLKEFMLSGPVVALVIEGPGCIAGFRAMAGATDPSKADPGTIRADLRDPSVSGSRENVVHGSDSAQSAAREIRLWFPAL